MTNPSSLGPTESLEICSNQSRLLSATQSGCLSPWGDAADELLVLITALLHLETSHLDVATTLHL